MKLVTTFFGNYTRYVCTKYITFRTFFYIRGIQTAKKSDGPLNGKW